MANRRNGSSWSLSGTDKGYDEVVDPFKAVYGVRKKKIQGIYQTKGMACSVYVKKDDKEVAYFVTWSGLTKHFNKPAQMNRFSSEHVGEYSGTVDWNSTVATFGHFSFLPAFSIFSSLPSKKVFVIAFKAVQEQEFTSDLEAYCFVGPQKLKLKLEFQRDTRTHKLLTSDTSGKDRKLEWSSVLGAPIIVKNTKISAHNSGARWSVVGVVGLGREGELCPHFVTNTIFEQEATVHPSNEARIINDTPGQPVPSDVAQPPISQTPENTTNPPGGEAVDASGQPVPSDVAQPPISQIPENTTNPPGGEAVDASDVILKVTLRLARGGLWFAGTASILARYSNDPQTMTLLFYLIALPAGIVLNLMVPGSIICILQVNDLNALRTLWQNYESGLLKKNLEYVLITEDLRKLAKGDEIIMDVFLYCDVCVELVLNQKKGDKVYKEERRQPRRLSYPMREKDKSMFQVYQPPFYHQGHPGPSDVVQRSIGQTNPPGGEAVHASGHPAPSDVVQRSIGQTNPPGGEAVHASVQRQFSKQIQRRGKSQLDASSPSGDREERGQDRSSLEDLMIEEHPKSQTRQEGSKVELKCKAGNEVIYQWFKDNTEMKGETNSSLIFDPVRVRDFGVYKCEVRRFMTDQRYLTSDKAELDVTPRDGMSYSELSTVFINYYEVKEEVASELSREIAGRKTWKQVALEYDLKRPHLLEMMQVPGDGVIESINGQFPNLTVYEFCKTLKKVRRLDIVKILSDHLCSPDA